MAELKISVVATKTKSENSSIQPSMLDGAFIPWVAARVSLTVVWSLRNEGAFSGKITISRDS